MSNLIFIRQASPREMATKRKTEDGQLVMDTKNKKIKSGEAQFNGTLFKSMLKDKSKVLKGLETFVKVAKDLPGPDLYDVVEGYIKISAECQEIFALLEEETHNEYKMMLVFQSLEAILLRTASDLSHLSLVGSSIVKKMVLTHMKLLQSCLQTKNYRFVRQCLCLLSALVSQGAEAARDVFNQIHFNKAFFELAQRRDRTGKPDVRMAYIQFILSFLISGDRTTICQVLDCREFLSNILTKGLKDDRLSIVNLVLSTLLTRVVKHNNITKTQKVRFFNAVVLRQIATLYRWNGMVDVSMEEEGAEAGKQMVRELTHKFLLELCCSRKHGISFHDPSLGTSGRPGNLVLLHFVVGLTLATEDELIAELLVKVLEASPDLLGRFFKETKLSFAPRQSKAWQDNISLLKKIYEAQPEVSTAFNTREVIPLPRLLSMVLITTLPSVCNKAFFTQGLKLTSLVVQQTTLSFLVFTLKRAQKTIEHCLEKSNWETSNVYSSVEMEEFVLLYREALSKILPEIVVVVSCWQSHSQEIEKSTNSEISQPKPSEKCAESERDDPCLIMVKALLLQVMCLYQRTVPHLISQSNFDFSKLLKGIVTERGMKQEVPPVLQFQVLQLALELPASKFSWFHFEELNDEDFERSLEKSVFYLLLKMFVSCGDGHLKSLTRSLVIKVLRDSGVFEHTWRELELWLDHLTRLDQSQQETVVQFLDHVLMRAVCMPHVYTEKAASSVQEAANLQASLNPDMDVASIPISHIDDVLDMVDVIMEGSEGEIEEIGPTLTEDLILQTFPFSSIVPAVLETRNKQLACFRDQKGMLLEYVADILCDILHCQRDPLALCLILQEYDEELSATDPTATASISSFQRYYSQWLPKDTEQPQFKTVVCPESRSPAGFSALLKACFTDGPEALLQDAFKEAVQDALLSLDVSQRVTAAQQVLLYLRSFALSFSSIPKVTAEAVIGVLMSLLDSLILKLLDSETPEVRDETELFLETNPLTAHGSDHKQTCQAVLRSVFKHPTLEQWFLALQLNSFPPHSLNPVHLKRLCLCLSEGILKLLESSGEALRDLGSLEVISSYLNAAHRAVMKELQDEGTLCPKQESMSVRAFLTLQHLQDPVVLKEVMSTLLHLPLECLVSAEQQLSIYGQALLKLLSESMKRSSEFSSRGFPLSPTHLKGLASLFITCQSVQLEDFLRQVLTQVPGSAKLLHMDVLLHCLHNDSPSTREIGALLLQNCPTHVLRFEHWCLENLAQISACKDSFLFLLSSYLKRALRHKEIQDRVLKALKKTLMAPLWLLLKEGEAAGNAGLQVEVLSDLIRLAGENSDLSMMMRDLPEVLQKPDALERWKLADAVSEKLIEGSESLSFWRKSLLSAALMYLSAIYKENKEPHVQHEEALLARLKALMVFSENIKAPHWNAFVKSGLKYRYRDCRFLEALSSLVETVYGSEKTPGDLVPLATIHMMSSSHSLFLPTMLSTSSDDPRVQEAKAPLVSLLLTLVRKCPEVCNNNHFLVLLGAYGASLSTTDQKLLLVLQEYEKSGISLTEFQYVLWGPAAVKHHQTRASLGPSLWQTPSSEQLLSLLVPEKMRDTITHFPLQRFTPVPEGNKNSIYAPERKESLDLYDPCFLLPLFSFILRPECSVDCRKFVSCDALGVTVAALSSFDPKLRAAAYQVLGCYCQHLESARFREKKQLQYLLDTVKNGIVKLNARVPFVHAIYIAKAAQQIFRPEDHMYMAMSKFLLGIRFLDLRRVPDFFRLFYSCDLQYRQERSWILSVVEDGIGEQRGSFELCEAQNIFQTLLAFGNTALCDLSSQVQILHVLRECARVSRGAYVLVKEHGLLTWMVQIVEKRNLDSKLLSALIELLHTLWFTNQGEKENKPKGKHLPLTIINQFLCTLLIFSRRLG
ncbi:hypothetical protein DNTS_006350 [Danionella cerebrum]|uniref:Nucleolar pre-ribosomal-associated protein 1 C-terminal domain-containing protein n=1 Tax=Danionella cerebrum TaxID=2873325 RepID=A0A553Q5E7_9TELE|nr:hypothetical protein DNTS_006350 [Danionella translucida]